jgi:hypothetical protein
MKDESDAIMIDNWWDVADDDFDAEERWFWWLHWLNFDEMRRKRKKNECQGFYDIVHTLKKLSWSTFCRNFDRLSDKTKSIDSIFVYMQICFSVYTKSLIDLVTVLVLDLVFAFFLPLYLL